jgi:quercetin dioxygenase-like cupin family protein
MPAKASTAAGTAPQPARHGAGLGNDMVKSEQPRFVARTPSGWEDVEREGYVPGEPGKVIRHTLVGGRKADPAEPGPALEVRYFEVPPGAVTRLEKHEHEHFVIVGAGTGHAIVGETVREVRAHDVVYVGPLEPHQFVNRGDETFGFFCVVTAQRDFSQAIEGAELSRLLASAAGAFADPHGAPRPRRSP